MKNARNLPKIHVFDGKKYKLKWRKPRLNVGSCDDPKTPADQRYIFVDKNLLNRDTCEVLIHEGLHAEQWYLDEPTVTRIAANLTDLLERCGLIQED